MFHCLLFHVFLSCDDCQKCLNVLVIFVVVKQDPLQLRDHPECDFVRAPAFGMIEVYTYISQNFYGLLETI